MHSSIIYLTRLVKSTATVLKSPCNLNNLPSYSTTKTDLNQQANKVAILLLAFPLLSDTG